MSDTRSLSREFRDNSTKLLQSAVLAPSSHNTQPWRFRISGDRVELYADRTRALPVNDPENRELTISCGCALMNIRVAAAEAGLPMNAELLPNQNEGTLLAVIDLLESGFAFYDVA